jgi:shikimate 5-dehydrogenase
LHYHEAYRACDQVPQGENVPDIVDTIEIINGELVGKFFLPLDLAHSLPFDGKRVLIIGTTPLAFALGSTLGSLPITSLTYGAPTLEEAHAFTSKLKVISSLEEEWFSTTRAIDLSSYDIIINATTHKNNDQEQLPHFKNGDHNKIFIDFHLTLEETYISKTATLLGAKAILGYDMALFQARGAYQRWLNKAPVINNEHLTIITEDFTRECQLTKGLTNG